MEHQIKSWLSRHKIRQWMFADMIGVDESTLSCYISGKITILPKTAVAIQRETKRIDPDDFITAMSLLIEEDDI